MENKKIKWPKFLTFKRTLLLIIIIVVAIILLAYFVGGYKAITGSTKSDAFDKTGFVDYETGKKAEEEKANELLEKTKLEAQEIFGKVENIVKVEKRPLTGNDLADLKVAIDELKFKEQAELYTTGRINSLNRTLESEKLNYRTDIASNALKKALGLDQKAEYDETYLLSKATELVSKHQNEINTLKDTLDSMPEEERKKAEATIASLEKEITTLNKNMNTISTNSAKEKVAINNFEMINELYRLLLTKTSGTSALPEMAVYVVNSLAEWIKAFENNAYEFYFSRALASFKIVEKSTGNVWYSNPNEETSVKNPSIKQEQKSQLNVWYAGSSGATLLYTSYEHSVSNTNTRGDQTLTPSFYYKINEDSKTVQVWYHLSNTRGRKYQDYPSKIRKTVLDAIFARNEELINSGEYEGTKFENPDLIKTAQYLAWWMNQDSQDPAIKNKKQEDWTLAESFVELKKWVISTYGELVAVDKQTNKPVDEPYYELTNYENMTLINMNYFHTLLYDLCDFTTEDLTHENEHFDINTEVTKAEFDIAIEYKLTETGLEAKVINESIVEPVTKKQREFLFIKWYVDTVKYPITNVDILPYFTAVNDTKVDEVTNETTNTDGYILIPDGSGAIMNFNNGKTTYTQYLSKRVYSTDTAFASEVKQVEKEDILLPMYAVISQNKNGSSVTSAQGVIVSSNTNEEQLALAANVSGARDSYNRAYYTMYYRETQQVNIGTGYYLKKVIKWTEERFKGDAVVKYDLISNTTGDITYGDVARKYREQIGLNEINDATNETVINTEVVGLYDYYKYFLGVKYTAYDTLTTYKQAGEIVDKLLSLNKDGKILSMNLYYIGWRKKGLISESYQNMSYSKKLGSKKQFENLEKKLKNNEIGFYPFVDFGEINKYQESFGKSRYTIRDVSGDFVEKRPYDLATNVYDKEQRAIYTLSPKYYVQFMDNLISSYNKKVKLDSIALGSLGSTLPGDYKKDNVIFRDTTKAEQIKMFEMLSDSGINKLTLKAPYQYALKYTDGAPEVPYESTTYEIFDFSIPFYQMVITGAIDYSGLVINANDEKGYTWHMMHILGSGSNLAFTFSYEDSSSLIQTDYNYYYYTQYTKWLDDVAAYVKELAAYGIHGCVLKNYEALDGFTRVYKVTYQDKISYKNNASIASSNEVIEVYLNYSDANVDLPGVGLVHAKNYVVYRNGVEVNA